MENCSLLNHKDIIAITFCGECKIYMCNKCEKFHSELFPNHKLIKLEKGKDISELFTGLCEEKNHRDKLKYFCKTHNKLCCLGCIAKLKDKEIGQHSNCDICFVEDIENDKKNKLKDNIKYFEDNSLNFLNLEEKINKLKVSFEKFNKAKEEFKTNIQKIFTKLRNVLNDREDEILLEIDSKYNNFPFNDEIIKKSEKLPNKIKSSLEKGKELDNNWNNEENIISRIKICLNIENLVNDIKSLKDNLEKSNSINFVFEFYPKEGGINKLLETIKKFGKIGKTSKFDTKIEFDEELIESWLGYREFKTELLYRKSRDGSSPDDFHNRCDNKGITIVFIETTKGYKFGGYTELSWDKSNRPKRGPTFIFSLNRKCYFGARNNNATTYWGSNEGPKFGCSSPEIYLYGTLDKGESFDDSSCTFTEGRLLTNGERYWDVKELEIHKIIYIN